MLKIDRHNKAFSCLDTQTFADASITERNDLQEYICNSPDAFFKEIEQDLFVIAKEVQPSDDVQDRIDILALDEEGQAVVVELKRGNNKLQMFQAISYAGMVAGWEPKDFLDFLTPERLEELQQKFPELDIEQINRHQRLILVAEQFDYSVLVGAEWLSERHNVNIVCCRISLARDTATGTEFLVCSNVFPAPELVKVAVQRRRRRTGMSKPKWVDWEAALADVTNPAVAAYFKKEVNARAGVDCYLRKRIIRYRVGGIRRWSLAARRQTAYGWQDGRFDGDLDYWRGGLSQPDLVKEVKGGRCLSFSLSTDRGFQFFHHAVTQQLVGKTWTKTADDEEADGEVDGGLEEA
jgi:hypothetical protein